VLLKVPCSKLHPAHTKFVLCLPVVQLPAALADLQEEISLVVAYKPKRKTMWADQTVAKNLSNR
jgi:hypothetical protein